MKIKPVILHVAMALVGLSFATAAVARDKPSEKPTISPHVAPTPGPNDFLTDLDNENNKYTGTADGDMDSYLYNNDPVNPIEFNISVTQNPKGRGATLRMDVFDVDTNTTPGDPEIDKVYINDIAVGTLNGSENVWGVNLFDIPANLLRQGKNQVKILVDRGNPAPNGHWAVQVDWGLISLSPKTEVNIEKAWINPERVQKKGYINIFAEISGTPAKIGKVDFVLGNTKLTTLTDPDGDGTYSGQYQVTQAPGYYSTARILVKSPTGQILSKWPGFTVTP